VRAQQGGRIQGPETRRPSPDPGPLPRVRLPEEAPTRQPAPLHSPPEDTIRISTDLVNVVATVVAQTPQPFPPLTREDFQLFEDGQPQEIVNFARDADLPLRLVILLDTSLSVGSRLDFQRQALITFLQRILRPGDQAAIFSISTDVTLVQSLTDNLATLTLAAKRLRPSGATSLYDGVYLAADYLQAVEGRRIAILLSDGADTTSQKSLLEALQRAQEVDLILYAVFTGHFGISHNLRDLAGERALEALTLETGGEVLYPQAPPGSRSEEVDRRSLQELELSFESIALQLRTQYVLGFHSTNDRRDGSYRRLTLEILRPGLRPRARTGYYAPR
jgi:Ca-activated chloride channel family protein